MKNRLALFLSLAVLSSCDTKPTIYNGAYWGMSVDDVQRLYKVKPSKAFSDQLQYQERLEYSTTTYEVTYDFDARTGLNQIRITANSIRSERDKEDEIKNIEAFFFNKQVVRLIDEATDFSNQQSVITSHFVFDRIYRSTNANIRSELAIEKSFGGSYYIASITFIPPGWKWKTTPSEAKAASSSKHK